jgi:hypothetical protein
LLLAVAGPVAGQQIRGQVTDAASGRPVRGALVSALDRQDATLAVALSDSAGQFVLDRNWPASVRLRVERLAYARLESAPWSFAPSDTIHLELRLTPEPIQLAGIVAAARRTESNLAGFLRRRQVRKFGAFLGPAQIAAINPRSADHLLSLFVGLERDITGPGILGRAGYTINPGMGGTTSAAYPQYRSPGCRPWVYIDGRPMEPWRVGYGWNPIPEPTSVDFYLPVQVIRGVEVYRYWYDAPAQYIKGTGRSCAIVLVWTDYGFGFRARPPVLEEASR